MLGPLHYALRKDKLRLSAKRPFQELIYLRKIIFFFLGMLAISGNKCLTLEKLFSLFLCILTISNNMSSTLYTLYTYLNPFTYPLL